MYASILICNHIFVCICSGPVTGDPWQKEPSATAAAGATWREGVGGMRPNALFGLFLNGGKIGTDYQAKRPGHTY